MSAVGSISDTKVIIKASGSHDQHDGAAAFTLSDDHFCRQLSFQKTSQEDELKY
jgi:hypothetical protein